jgi:hypothetical protein
VGDGNGALMRDLLDLDAWIMASGLGPGVRLEGARRAFWEVIRGGGAMPAQSGDRTLFVGILGSASFDHRIRSLPSPAGWDQWAQRRKGKLSLR